MASATAIDDSHMIAADLPLHVGVSVFRIPQAVIPAGHVALPILDFSDQIVVIDNEVGNDAIRKGTLAAVYVAAGALQVLQYIPGFHIFRRVFIHHGLAFNDASAALLNTSASGRSML